MLRIPIQHLREAVNHTKPTHRTPTMRRTLLIAVAACAALTAGCAMPTRTADHDGTRAGIAKRQVSELLRSIETRDSRPVSAINPDKYVQHNLGVADGLAGFNALMAQLPVGSARVNIKRVFQDGNFVFTHTDYEFFGRAKVGFDIFRFEDGKIVEHWDNLQDRPMKPNPSGRTMTDGPVDAADVEKTAANKVLVRAFVDDVLVNGRVDRLDGYFSGDNYIQHNPSIPDQASGLKGALQALVKQGLVLKYNKIHHVLGEGNFVLVSSEGSFAGNPVAFFDLFRVQNGKIAEHWDTVEAIPPRAQWKNGNGKF